MGQDIHTLFGFRPAAERFVENGVVGDPVRDDEAPFWAVFGFVKLHLGVKRTQVKTYYAFLHAFWPFSGF